MWMDTSASIVQELEIEQYRNRGIRVLVKRDDLIHPEVSGNKWRKLKYNLAHYRTLKKEAILTFGGAYSNHLLATASACFLEGIPAIGLVRGEELTVDANSVLSRCAELGMQFEFISRDEYALRGMKEYHEELTLRYPNTYIIEEGGAGYYGMIGCQEILKEINEPFDHVFVAQGTTTTSCGLLLGLNGQQLHVVPALKGFDSPGEMQRLLGRTGIDPDLVEDLLERVRVHADYHFGGYAKSTPELEQFITEIEKDYGLPLDSVYTAKAFFALWKELEKPEYDNQTVLFVHTGGLFLQNQR